MDKCLGCSTHADRSTRRTLAACPQSLDIHLAAQYLNLGESSISDYVAEDILQPVELPGSILRDPGNVVAHGTSRRIKKNLIDRESLDTLIDARKASQC
jgi:hypothetical protein